MKKYLISLFVNLIVFTCSLVNFQRTLTIKNKNIIQYLKKYDFNNNDFNNNDFNNNDFNNNDFNNNDFNNNDFNNNDFNNNDFNNNDFNSDELDNELDNEFGSEIEKIFKRNKIKTGVRIFYPKDNPPKILKEYLEESKKTSKKSKNFEIVYNNDFNFSNIGGYDLIKKELLQCSDILLNYTKYEKYNVRVPKGLILEGPPGNGKTILTRAFSGEINIGFISVSGSQFQEMYVGVGASRVRELFKFADENKPCIIFIDEIDAIGRKRSTGIDSSSTERDSTLNELLVGLDGFKTSNGIFLIGATNRIDLLDNALIRPGRIDKKIYIGNPDKKTRKEIIEIHLKGKPYDVNISLDKLVDITNGFSGAEIENLLNEAMLYALREGREKMTKNDVEVITNKILTGWQITENKLSEEMIKQIAIHEIGHALVSIFVSYKKILKVCINLWSPNTLGFTMFEETPNEVISTKENLLKEIMVLLGGRVAEEIFYGDKISSGAVDDFHRVKNIIQKMVLDYGMGTNLLTPQNSDKYKEKIDVEIENIFNNAYKETKYLLLNSKQLVNDCALLLIIENEINEEQILNKLNGIYDYLKK
jgi:cell division protease FtsH